MALPENAQRRLLQLIGMSGSSFDAEALGAIKRAHRLAAEHGCTLIEAIETAPAEIDLQRLTALEQDAFDRGFAAGRAQARPNGAEQHVFQMVTWHTAVETCLHDHALILTAWEREFLQSWLTRGWSRPTQKQAVVLGRIADKCGVPTP